MDFQNSRPRNDQNRNHQVHSHRAVSFSANSFNLAGAAEDSGNCASGSKRVANWLSGIITFSLVAIFFGVPLFFTGLAYQGISFEKQIYFYFWILLALVAWVTKSVISGEMHLKRTPLDIPIVVFVFFYSIATIFSIDRWHSFWGYFGDPSRGLMNVLALFFAYYIAINHFNLKRFYIIIWSLVVASFLASFWTIVYVMGFDFPEKIQQYVPVSMTGSLTGVGILLGAMVPLLMTLIFAISESKRKSWLAFCLQFFLIASIALNLFLLLAIYNYVSWSGILVGVSFFLVYVLAQIIRPKYSVTWVPMAAFVAILVILMIGSNQIARRQLPLEVTPSYAMSWEIAKQSLKDSFFVGSGPATYWYDFSKFKPQEFNVNPYYNLRFYQGSGILFESLPTIGVVGTLLVLFIVITYLGVGVYLLSIDKKKNKILSLGAFSASLIFLLNAFAGKIEGSVLVIGVLLAALSVAVLNFESDAEERKLTLSLKASPKFALSLAFLFMVVSAGVVFLFVFVGKAYLADLTIGNASRSLNSDINKSLEKTAQAIQINGRESRYYVFFSQQALALANTEALKEEKQRDVNKIQQSLNDAIFSANQAKELSKNDVTAVEAAAQVYENSSLYVADSASFAEENYKRALELEPENAIYHMRLGQLKLAQSSQEKEEDKKKSLVSEAKDLFQKSIDKKNNLAEAYNQLSIAKESLNDLDGAIVAQEQAAIIERGNPNYIFSLARLYQARGKENDFTNAELLYKEIINQNDKEINTHFSLGTLYEKIKKSDEAKNQYKKVLELLPADNESLRKQIEKMISNMEQGIENTAENILGETVSSQEIVPSEADQGTVPVAQ